MEVIEKLRKSLIRERKYATNRKEYHCADCKEKISKGGTMLNYLVENSDQDKRFSRIRICTKCEKYYSRI